MNYLLRRSLCPIGLAIFLLVSAAAPYAGPPRADTFTRVDRIVAVGDVHGGYDEFVSILRDARVIDVRTRWSGGRTHLVQTGDLLDRAGGSRRVMDLVLRLATEARAAGGRVHALLGNHEVMNVTGDLRYTSPDEFAAFVTAASGAVQNRAYAVLADPSLKEDSTYREKWYADHPLGWAEHRQAFGADGRYGKWIRQRRALVRIDDYLFLHGGLNGTVDLGSISEINDRLSAEVRQHDVPKGGLAAGRDGPLWYRGLAGDTDVNLRAPVDALLARFGVKHIVIGHTTMPGAVVPRLGGKVLLIDVGLSRYYGAHAACLVIQRGTPYALHRGRLLPLPLSDDGALLSYLRSAAALDPAPSPLRPLIDAGGHLPLPADSEKR